MNSKTGVLYIVATPIGNLRDLSPRAQEILQEVDLILAEDTRQTKVLMRYFHLTTPLRSFHQHNERRQVKEVLKRLSEGEDVALVSDAGTPLISDPGYPLVSEARRQGFEVSPIPGPCALVAALSASGLAVDRFVFEGFMPTKEKARNALLDRITEEVRTVVLYESSHRILKTMDFLSCRLGFERVVVVGREISKVFETFYLGRAGEVLEQLKAGPDHQRGEFVIMVSGASARNPEEDSLRRLLALLLEELSISSASRIAASWFGVGRGQAYSLALEMGNRDEKTG